MAKRERGFGVIGEALVVIDLHSMVVADLNVANEKGWGVMVEVWRSVCAYVRRRSQKIEASKFLGFSQTRSMVSGFRDVKILSFLLFSFFFFFFFDFSCLPCQNLKKEKKRDIVGDEFWASYQYPCSAF